MAHGNPATGRQAIMVTSLEVAEYFDKRHSSVLRDIRRVLAGLSPAFSQPNFVERFRIIEGAHGKTAPYYELRPDGFALLTLGYCGKKALANKVPLMGAGDWSVSALSAILSGRHARAADPASPSTEGEKP
jgi:Rha family phage regulatory protein